MRNHGQVVFANVTGDVEDAGEFGGQIVEQFEAHVTARVGQSPCPVPTPASEWLSFVDRLMPLQAVAFDLVVERAPIDVQNLGGVSEVPLGFFEDALDCVRTTSSRRCPETGGPAGWKKGKSWG